MLSELRKQVYEANMLLPRYGLVQFTWGNVSGIDRASGLVVIKPSGVAYEALTPENLVITDLDGTVVEGKLRPSSDLDTHLELYRSFPDIGGVTHTHSMYATAFAQARCDIPALGTTHADYFDGTIPCTRPMTDAEINGKYELETGRVIVETLKQQHIDPLRMHAVLVCSHGPFTWGINAGASVEASAVLENVAQLAVHTAAIRQNLGKTEPMQQCLLRKHFDRKHGPGAYYGQKK